MSLNISYLRRRASSAVVASTPLLPQLHFLSGRVGISLQPGQELTSLHTGLVERYPRGVGHLGLESHHEIVLNRVMTPPQEWVETPELVHVVPAMEALVAKETERSSQEVRFSIPAPAAEGPSLEASPAVRFAVVDHMIAKNRLLLPPQGGAALATSEGLICFGAQPWINKWAYGLYLKAGGTGIPRSEVRHSTPTVFIHDSQFSGPDNGLIPFDFLGYMGFAVADTQYTFVAENPEQADNLTRYLKLSYLAKRTTELTERVVREYPPDALAIPDLLAEMERGFTSPPTEERWISRSTDENGRIQIGKVTIERLGNQRFRVTDHNALSGVIDLKKYPPRRYRLRLSPESEKNLQETLRGALEGKPGLWPIGTSDGFDPHGATSGFMMWNQGRCLLVDPPSHTLDYLEAVGIPLDRIEGVILTHGHTDHCGDVVPKLIRQLPSLRFYTTPTIHDMLSEQFELALGRRILDGDRFQPVFPGRLTEINGMTFDFDYTFHTVPSIGFDLWRKSGELALYFSGDTLASPEALEAKLEKDPSIMNAFRLWRILRHSYYVPITAYQEHPPLILLDNGVPPTHTQPTETRAIIEDLEKEGLDASHILAYHIARKRARRAKVPSWKEGHSGWKDLVL